MTITLDQKKLENCEELLRLANEKIKRMQSTKVVVREPKNDKRDIVYLARAMCDEIAGYINDGCGDAEEYARGSIEIYTVLMDEVSRLRNYNESLSAELSDLKLRVEMGMA